MKLPKTICITNRTLAGTAFLQRIETAAKTGVDALILREKDLTASEYETLARQVLALCEANQTPCILHSFTEAAKKLGHPLIHLTMKDFVQMTENERKEFQIIGVSTHTVDEAILAEHLGADYITASHIFPTDCKAGLAPRGLDYLREVCAAVTIPVYALGGIHPENVELCIEAGAAGVCMMSEYMDSLQSRSSSRASQDLARDSDHSQ